MVKTPWLLGEDCWHCREHFSTFVWYVAAMASGRMGPGARGARTEVGLTNSPREKPHIGSPRRISPAKPLS
jgi:hypothetical protein